MKSCTTSVAAAPSGDGAAALQQAFRSLSLPLSRIGFVSNPWLLAAVALMIALQVAAVYWPPLQHMLRTTGLEPAHWQLLLALALPLVAVPELAKLAIYFRKKKMTRLAA